MPFWTTFFRSFTDLSCYRDRIVEPMHASLWYFIRFYLLLLIALGATGFFGGNIIAKAVLPQIPQDAVFHISPEKITTENINLPLTLTLLFESKATVQTESIELDLPHREPLHVPLKDFIPRDASYTFTGKDVSETLPTLLPTTLALTTLTFMLVLFVGRVFSLFFYALFFSWIIQFFGKRVYFWKLVQLSMHITVTAEVITILSTLLYRSTTFPMFEVAFTLLMVLVLKSLQQPSEQNG